MSQRYFCWSLCYRSSSLAALSFSFWLEAFSPPIIHSAELARSSWEESPHVLIASPSTPLGGVDVEFADWKVAAGER